MMAKHDLRNLKPLKMRSKALGNAFAERGKLLKREKQVNV